MPHSLAPFCVPHQGNTAALDISSYGAALDLNQLPAYTLEAKVYKQDSRLGVLRGKGIGITRASGVYQHLRNFDIRQRVHFE